MATLKVCDRCGRPNADLKVALSKDGDDKVSLSVKSVQVQKVGTKTISIPHYQGLDLCSQCYAILNDTISMVWRPTR